MGIKLAETYVELKTVGLQQATDAIRKTGEAFDQVAGDAGQATVAVDTYVESQLLINRAKKQGTVAEREFERALADAVQMERAATAVADRHALALDALQEEAKQTGQALRRTAGAAGNLRNSATRLGPAVYQLGQAAEDAAIGFGLNGWSGALIGAGNNLAFVASMMNPVAGGIVGLGVAAAATTIRLSGMGEATRNANTELEQHLELLRLLAKQRGEEVGNQQERRDVTNLADARDRVSTLEDELAKQQAVENEFARAANATANRLEGARNRVQEIKDEYDRLTNDWDLVAAFPLAGQIHEWESHVSELEQQLQHERDLIREQSREVRFLADELNASRERLTEIAPAEFAGDVAAEVGGFLNSLPDRVRPGVAAMMDMEERLRELGEQSIALADERDSHKDYARFVASKEGDAKGMKDIADQTFAREQRQAEFGGIGDLARRLQERANARQEQLLQQTAENTRASRDALEDIRDQRQVAVAG